MDSSIGLSAARSTPRDTRTRWLPLLVLALMGGAWLQGAAAAADPNNIASWHSYCYDYDGDSFGDPNLVYPVMSETPPVRNLTTDCSDPNDYNPFIYPDPLAKGTRSLGLNFADSGTDGKWRPDLAREIGADAAPLRVTWGLIETTPGHFDGPQAAALTAALAYAAQGFKVSLTVSLTHGATFAGPADLDLALRAGTARLSDAAVIKRFNALLQFIHDRLGNTALVSLQLGDDLDQLAGQNAFLGDYLLLFKQAAPFARGLWGADLKVASTLNFDNLGLLRTQPSLYNLVAAGDFLSLTLYSSIAVLPIGSSPKVETQFQIAVATAQGKPVAFQEVIFTTANLFGSSVSKQVQYLQAFFTAWDKYRDQVFYASFSRLFDPLPSTIQALGEPFATYLGAIGLRQIDGTAKPGYHTLRNQAFERGWWRVETPSTRPFRMGFTQLMYDTPTDPYENEWVKAWTDYNRWKASDISAIHMDGGVPWTEALNDDLRGLEPPYAQSLLNTWRLASSRKIPGQKLLVSVNPLGIPRRVIAPYWGYGEGFTYAPDFTRVGDGKFADDESRLPPPPFDTHPINHPDVERAYLNYVQRVITYFRPDFLCIGIEVSAAQVADPIVFAQYLELHKYVYQHLKANPAYAGVKIMVSVSATSFMTDELGPLLTDTNGENGVAYKYDEMASGVRAGVIRALRDVLPYTDVLGLSLYPHYGKYNAYVLPASIYESLFATLQQAGLGNKPIAVTESGYAADAYTLLGNTLFLGSAEKQERHIKLMFHELAKQPNPVEFVINYEIRDTDLAWNRLKATASDERFIEFYKYFRDMGLYDGDGRERPALGVWQKELALPYAPRPSP